MVKVVADNYIKTEKEEEFILLAKQLVQTTRENDLGCIRYELLQDMKNPQHLIMLEEWEDQVALDRHLSSEHFQETMARFADCMENPGEVHLFQKLA